MKKYKIGIIFALISFSLIDITGNFEKKISTNTFAEKINGKLFSKKESLQNDSVLEIPAKLKNCQELILKRKGYTVSYNKHTLLPNWVAWQLTKNRTRGKNKRAKNIFIEDIEVPSPRANNSDYKNSGWSRGHMCPAGDNKWDKDAMHESFLLSNICPQNSKLNSGDWNEIEQTCRKWATKHNKIYIVCGPIIPKEKQITIGHNQIVVPEAFFKVVLTLHEKPKGIGFICENTDTNRKKYFYVKTIDEVEKITGIDFFHNLPNEIEKIVEAKANIADW